MKHRCHFSVCDAMLRFLRRVGGTPTARDECRKPERDDRELYFQHHLCYPTSTSTCWITFHIKPLRFHCSLLWVSSIAFVARAIRRYCPRFAGVQLARQRRHEYFPISVSSRASAHVAPPSVDTSTPLIPHPH